MTESGPQDAGRKLVVTQKSDQQVNEGHSNGDVEKSENQTDTPNSCAQFDAASPESDLHQQATYDFRSSGIPSSPVDSLHSMDSASSASIHCNLIQYMDDRSLSSRERFIQWYHIRGPRRIKLASE